MYENEFDKEKDKKELKKTYSSVKDDLKDDPLEKLREAQRLREIQTFHTNCKNRMLVALHHETPHYKARAYLIKCLVPEVARYTTYLGQSHRKAEVC